MSIPAPATLARSFCAELRKTLTAAQLAVVLRRNASPDRDPSVCHSHDFCDANEVMLAATKKCRMRFDFNSDAHSVLWKAAWRMASAAGFDAAKVQL